MFNRHLQMKMVKNEKPVAKTTVETQREFEEKVAAATFIVDNAVKKVAIGVAGYVVLDTFRKVLVTLASK